MGVRRLEDQVRAEHPDVAADLVVDHGVQDHPVQRHGAGVVGHQQRGARRSGRFSAPRTSTRNQDWTSGRSRGRKILVVNSGSKPKSSIGVVTAQPAPGEGDDLVGRSLPVHARAAGEGDQRAHRIAARSRSSRRTQPVQSLPQQSGSFGSRAPSDRVGGTSSGGCLGWEEVGLAGSGSGLRRRSAADRGRSDRAVEAGPVGARGQSAGRRRRRRPAAAAGGPAAAELDDLRVSHGAVRCRPVVLTASQAASTRSVLTRPGGRRRRIPPGRPGCCSAARSRSPRGTGWCPCPRP